MAEENFPSELDDVSPALPALTRTDRMARRAAASGFDWPDLESAFCKIEEELGELREAVAKGEGSERVKSEMGDLLFAVANLGIWLKQDPEAALADTNDKFERRFRFVEREIARQGRKMKDVPVEELDALWDKVRAEDKGRER